MLNKLRMNGAEALASTLVESGVQVVFGIPGVHNLVLFEALRRSGIHLVPTTHEQGAAFMANGYGRATGKPGVFVTIPGPGLTNTLTPIAEALMDSSPMLGIVTDVPQSEKTFQMHEIKQALVAQPIVKSVYTVQHASEISSTFKTALKETTLGEPGPCILQIPANVFRDRIDYLKDKTVEDRRSSITSEQLKQIETIVTRLSSTRRVGLFVGLGAAGAAKEVRLLAEWMNMPVATTGSGRGVVDETHPLSLGFAWKCAAIDSVNRIFATCDLVLAIGVKFSQNGTQNYRLQIPSPLIHIDTSSEVLGKNYKPDIAVTMDASDFLKLLLRQKAQLGPRHDNELIELIRVEKEICDHRLKSDTRTQLILGEETLSPGEFFEKLRGYIAADTILVTDSGYNERLTIRNWVVTEPRTLINPSNYESMGFSIPTAIGAALAFPKRKVIAIVGDGGLVMSGLEMMTAVRENINLSIIVLNNNGFGIIKKIQQDIFGASVAVDISAPDFKALAESIHINVQAASGGLSSLKQAVNNQTPILLEIIMQHKGPNPISRLKRRLKNDLKQGLQTFIR